MSKNKNIPRLRFPEFQTSPEWDEEPLGNIAQIVRGGSPRPIENYLTSDINGLNWLKIGDIDKDAKYVTCTKEKVLPTALSKTRVVSSGDLILSNSMSFGRPYILKIEACIHDGWIAITKVRHGVKVDYLYYLISTSSSQKYFLNNAAGSGVQNLNADIIKFLPLTIPEPKEQEKIAECLSSVDELITAQADKIAALKEHKKGLMQKLFPQNGKTTPLYRFSEFRNSPPWKEDEFANVINHSSGTSLEEYISPSGQYKFISIGNYTTDGKYFDNSQRIIANSKTLSKLLNANDLVMVLNDKTAKGDIIGATILIDKDNCYIYNQRSERIICKREVRARFLWIYLNSTGFRDKVYQISQGGTQIYVNFPKVKKLGVTYPISHDEQEKIAECLSSLDELISLHNEKLSALKDHKKGLMQQLFPTVEEE
jgi:type I restriction enzyme S subunit